MALLWLKKTVQLDDGETVSKHFQVWNQMCKYLRYLQAIDSEADSRPNKGSTDGCGDD